MMRPIVFDEYQRTMATVCRHYGVDEVQMLHSNKEYCVDARATVVHLCIEKGLTEADLVSLTGLTQPCVNKLTNSVRFRDTAWPFRETLKSVRR